MLLLSTFGGLYTRNLKIQPFCNKDALQQQIIIHLAYQSTILPSSSLQVASCAVQQFSEIKIRIIVRKKFSDIILITNSRTKTTIFVFLHNIGINCLKN
ncbi:hypothetical protein T12_4889 [Trichinella patagoniensis]|uniref:Uncharacterized protein n=1 Tax=Trichinella patagoniensis TaxID=990121 RepID=A0A0V0Z3U5_9BILA|nr:hypothetical protein T12_13237 [Trichinella patagoniensis]KRY07374.1 hypothetical protein T12_4889 [Trichinella patagoniensis]